MKNKIKNKLFDKLWKRCAWIAVVCFLLVGIGGVLSINYIHDAVTNHHIHSEVITVQDKIDMSDHKNYFTVIDTYNNTYVIVNNQDNYGQRMFNLLEINHRYKVILKEPELTDVNQHTHILQVHNDTSAN